MNYTESLKEACQATIKKLKFNYQTLEYILKNYQYMTSNSDKYGEACEYRVKVAKKFIDEHPTNHISDFITDLELETVLGEAETISAKLNEYFEGFTEPSDLVFEGVFQRTNVKNGGRIYPKGLWKNSYSDFMHDDFISSGGPSLPSSSSSSSSSSSTIPKKRKLKTRWTVDFLGYNKHKAYKKHEDKKRKPAMVHRR